MKTCLLLSITLLLSCLLLEAREFRDFTNKDGKTINAELLDFADGMVKIRSRGKVFEIPAEQLSDADQAFLNEWSLKKEGDEEQLYYSEVIFEDDFSSDGFGEGWGHYKSESVVAEGVLTGKTINIDDHPGVDSIRFEGRKDMQVSVKFRFAGPDAQRFNVWFDDKDYQGSHAGHIASVSIAPNSLSIADAKTGNMENSIYEKKKSAAGLDADTQAMLEEKTARFELDLKDDKEEWHELLIRTKDKLITVSIDGDEIGSLESKGNGHPTKSLVSLTTTINDVQYDDFSVKAAPNSDADSASN